MAVKSAYKPKKPVENIPQAEELPETNISEVKIDGEELEPVAAVSVEAEPDVEPPEVQQAVEAAVKADDAAAALKRQVDAVRQAEALQRQQAAQMMARQQPLTHEQKLELWKTQGLTIAEADFLREHPAMIDHPQIVSHAAAEATQAGIERDTPEYWSAVKTNFEENMKRLQAQAAAQPTPEFFRPPPVRTPAPRSEAHYVSAPVSREVPTGVTRELSPSQVRLSPDEIEHARVSGVSLKVYAENKLRLMKEKAAGWHQSG